MNSKTITSMVVMGIIGIILVTAVLVPIINTGVSPSQKYLNANSNYTQVRELDSGESYSLVRSESNVTEWDVNGETINTVRMAYVVATDTFAYLVNDRAQQSENQGTLFNWSTKTSVLIPSTDGVSFSFNDGTATITYGDTVVELPYSYALVMCPFGKGEYTSTYLSGYVTDYSQVSIFYSNFWGFNGNFQTSSGESVPVPSGGTQIEGYRSLIQFDADNKFTLTVDGTSNVFNIILVPVEVVAYENTQDLGVVKTLLIILPVFVIAGLLVAIVRWGLIRT